MSVQNDSTTTTATTTTTVTTASLEDARRAIDASIEIIKRAASSPDKSDNEIVYDSSTDKKCLKKLRDDPTLETVVWAHCLNLGEWNAIMLPRNCDCLYAIKNCSKKPVYLELVIQCFTYNNGWQFPKVRIEPGNIEWLFEGMPIMLVSLQYCGVCITLKDEDGNVINNNCGCTIEIYGSFFQDPVRRALCVTHYFDFVSTRSQRQYRQCGGWFSGQDGKISDTAGLSTSLERVLAHKDEHMYVTLLPLQSVDVDAQRTVYQQIKQLVEDDMEIVSAYVHAKGSDANLLVEKDDLMNHGDLAKMFEKEPTLKSVVRSQVFLPEDWKFSEHYYSLPTNMDCIYAIRNCGDKVIVVELHADRIWMEPIFVEPKTTRWLFDGMPLFPTLINGPMFCNYQSKPLSQGGTQHERVKNIYPTLKLRVNLFDAANTNAALPDGHVLKIYGAHWRDEIRRQLMANQLPLYFVRTNTTKHFNTYKLEHGVLDGCLHAPSSEDEVNTHRSTDNTLCRKREEASLKRIIDADMDIISKHANDATYSDELREDTGNVGEMTAPFADDPLRKSVVSSRFYCLENWNHWEIGKYCDCIYAIRNCSATEAIQVQLQVGCTTMPTFRVEPLTTQWLFDGLPLITQLLLYRSLFLTLYDEDGNVITQREHGIKLYGAYWNQDVRWMVARNDWSPNYFVSTRAKKSYKSYRNDFGECTHVPIGDTENVYRTTEKTFACCP